MKREELLKGLSPEQIEKVKACKTSEEILALAAEEDIELTDEQLEAVSGGACSDDDDDVMECPDCHSKDKVKKVRTSGSSGQTYKCTKCNITWTVW